MSGKHLTEEEVKSAIDVIEKIRRICDGTDGPVGLSDIDPFETMVALAKKALAILTSKESETAGADDDLLGELFRTVREIGYIDSLLRLTAESHNACMHILAEHDFRIRAEAAQEAREELTIYRVALEDIADGSHPDQGFEYSQTKLREIAKEALGSSTSLATTVKKNDNRKKCAELLAALKECIYCSENFGKAYAGRDARDRAKALIRKYECDAIAGKEEVKP